MPNETYDWDAYCDDMERAYNGRIFGKTCMECNHCEEPDEPFAGQIGWCLMSDCFVYESDTPKDMDCGAFE